MINKQYFSFEIFTCICFKLTLAIWFTELHKDYAATSNKQLYKKYKLHASIKQFYTESVLSVSFEVDEALLESKFVLN